MLKKALLAAAMITGLTLPANALLSVYITDGTAVFTCTDGQAGCDFGGGANNLLTLNSQIGNFFVAGTLSTSTSGAHNTLDISTFQLTNTSAVTDTLTILVGQNGFLGPVETITNSGGVTFHNNAGTGPSSLSFYADSTNAQPTVADPGDLLLTVQGTPILVVDSFEGTQPVAFASGGNFAMAMEANFLLASGAYVTGYAQSMDAVVTSAVPEPQTWLMMGMGFLGCAYLARRRKQKAMPEALAA